MPAAPIVFGREFFEVDPRSTALIVIDMQNAFVAEGATYETPPARTMLPNSLLKNPRHGESVVIQFSVTNRRRLACGAHL